MCYFDQLWRSCRSLACQIRGWLLQSKSDHLMSLLLYFPPYFSILHPGRSNDAYCTFTFYQQKDKTLSFKKRKITCIFILFLMFFFSSCRKMTELTDFSNHIYDQISSVKRMLDLSVAGETQSWHTNIDLRLNLWCFIINLQSVFICVVLS